MYAKYHARDSEQTAHGPSPSFNDNDVGPDDPDVDLFRDGNVELDKEDYHDLTLFSADGTQQYTVTF